MKRIFLSIAQLENRRLLSEWLAEQYEVLSPQADDNFETQSEQLLTQPFDLCLVDFASVRKLRQSMLARREAERPLFLPFVFLTSSKNIRLSTDHLEPLVDDIIHVPINKIELQTKLRVLLRSRSYSLQLQEAKEKVEQTLAKEQELNQLKSRFVSMVSHEFRNPLNGISGMAQVLEKYGDKLPSEKKAEVLQKLQRNVVQMIDMLDNLLLLSRRDADKLKLNLTVFDLEVFCRGLINEVQTAFEARHQINSIYEGQKKLNLDQKLLHHILSNLLTNACKYSPTDSTIDFEVKACQTETVFIIRDRGIGIPPEDLKRLFQSFHRASNVGSIQGTGLGLAIVKQCVDLHQGAIAVESEVNVGTTFTVTIPC